MFDVGFPMRGLLIFLLLMAAVTGSAHAKCELGGRESSCDTASGQYRIRLPQGPGPHPAVLYLYGSAGNSAEKLSYEGFVNSFLDRGYAVIVPAALDKRYVGGLIASGWFLRNSRANKKRNDTQFVAEVLADAEARHRIDRNRVLMAGMSNGGFLTWEIACHAPRMAAAYAPIAAGYLGAMPSRCDAPVRILHTHGLVDDVVPIDPDQPWRSGGATMTPAPAALNSIARTNGCTGSDGVRSLREYEHTSWRGCTRAASVDLLVHKGGHTIPLSWYSTILDWFEGRLENGRQPVSDALARETPAKPRFQRAGSSGQGNARFKRAAPTQ